MRATLFYTDRFDQARRTSLLHEGKSQGVACQEQRECDPPFSSGAVQLRECVEVSIYLQVYLFERTNREKNTSCLLYHKRIRRSSDTRRTQTATVPERIQDVVRIR